MKSVAFPCRCLTRYSETVSIVIRINSGFFDQYLFAEMERLNIGFICAAKFYCDIKDMIGLLPEAVFQHYFGKANEDVWQCFEFSDRRKSWAKSYRAIFWRPLLEEKQFLLPKSRPSSSSPPTWACSERHAPCLGYGRGASSS